MEATSQSVSEGSSVFVMLMSLYLVKRLGKKSIVKRRLQGIVNNHEDKENNVFQLARIRRTCMFVYGLVGYRECGVACAVGVTLLLRSLCDLKMVHLMTAVESSIVNRNPSQFKTQLRNFLGFMVPVALLNSLLNYTINELAICLREKISLRLLTKYTRESVFYRINNDHPNMIRGDESIAGDDGNISNGNHNRHESSASSLSRSTKPPTPKSDTAWDQVLTHDVEEFTFALAKLFSHILKPTGELTFLPLVCY
jgi:ABC-type uncharacterized transport system fused permease/ATPase subunit